MSGEEVLSIDDYVAQGYTRVQAIKMHYEALKQSGAPTTQTAAAETNRAQLQKRYEELQKISEQKGFVKSAVRSVNVERRLSQRLDINCDEDDADSQNSKMKKNNIQKATTAPVTITNNTPASTSTPNAIANNATSTPQPKNLPAAVRMPSPINVSSTRSVESRLFQALEDVETRSGLSKFSSSVGDFLGGETVDEEIDDEYDDEDEDDDPFPHFVDTATINPDEFKSTIKIELQSSEPTMDNISSFIDQSDYSEDEIKEFHFLIEQGFNIDEASDLVYQRRLNTAFPAIPPPPYDNVTKNGMINNVNNNNSNNIYMSSSPSLSPTSGMMSANSVSPPPPPSYSAAMNMTGQSPSNRSPTMSSSPSPSTNMMLPPPVILQAPAPYGLRSGQTPGGHIILNTNNNNNMSMEPLPQPQPQQPSLVKRIPLRANALTGNKEADLQQLLDRGYTYEQATEICDIIYADREAEQQQMQQRRNGSLPGMSVGGSSMSSGGLRKKRSSRKNNSMTNVNGGRKMMAPNQHHPDLEAMKLALLVSEQEAEYGVNMYDSLQPEDEDVIAEYMAHGYSLDEAVYEVFTNKMAALSNNKQRQLSGSSTNSGGLLRGLLTTNTSNVPGNNNAPVQMTSSPMARNLLLPARDTSSGTRDSPTLQMMAGNGVNNNTNRNSFGGANPIGGGSLQPTPIRMSQPIRIPPNGGAAAMMSPGIQQSFLPLPGSPSAMNNGSNNSNNLQSMMRKAGISTPPVNQMYPAAANGNVNINNNLDPAFNDIPGAMNPIGFSLEELIGEGAMGMLTEEQQQELLLLAADENMDEGMIMQHMMMMHNINAGMPMNNSLMNNVNNMGDFIVDVDYTAAKNIENEIELLMMMGYTRESAVRYLLEKAKRETPALPPMPLVSGAGGVLPRSRMNSRMQHPEEDLANMPLPVPIEIQIKDSDHMTVTSDLTGSVIMSVASSQRNRDNHYNNSNSNMYGNNNMQGYMAPRDLPPPPSSQLKYYGNDGLYQSSNNNNGYSGPNNGYGGNMMHQHPHLMHQINEEDEEDDDNLNNNNNMDENGDDYDAAIDFKHMYPYMNYEGVYNRQPHRNIFNLPEEERALKVGILISQQSATFDTNMYESIIPEDEPMINSLLALGFDEDETYLIIFERKFGPPGIGERSVRSMPSQYANSKKSIMRATDIEIDNASTESLQHILRMSRQEHEQKPGAVRMPSFQNHSNNNSNPSSNNNNMNSGNNNGNMNSSNNNNNNNSNDFSDINPRNMEILVSMGFTVDQVVHALRMNAYDLHSAAQYLLGGA